MSIFLSEFVLDNFKIAPKLENADSQFILQ